MVNQKTIKLSITGMTCINCQYKIEKALKNLRGVISVKVSYTSGTADVTYNSDILTVNQMKEVIHETGYEVEDRSFNVNNLFKYFGILAVILLLFLLLQHTGILNNLAPGELATSNASFGMLFVIGLITSVHCVAMCGGINLSQSLKKDDRNSLLPTIGYNLGRLTSYTAIGFILGGLGYLIGAGSEIGIPFALQGVLKAIAGVFMIIMGINVLDIFPFFRKFTVAVPRPIARVVTKYKIKAKFSFLVGVLNGFMPCGPLQSMWIVALASANPLVGGLSMFMFALGTMPLMLGLGTIVTALGNKFMKSTMKIGGILVAVLGLAMLSQGLALNGFNLSFPSNDNTTVSEEVAFEDANDVSESDSTENASNGDAQLINSVLEWGKYPDITVEAGVPVKWIIDVPQGMLTGCNQTMVIPEYGIKYTFDYGENVIEFTPDKTGIITYTCWMGMVTGNISVVD